MPVAGRPTLVRAHHVDIVALYPALYLCSMLCPQRHRMSDKRCAHDACEHLWEGRISVCSAYEVLIDAPLLPTQNVICPGWLWRAQLHLALCYLTSMSPERYAQCCMHSWGGLAVLARA